MNRKTIIQTAALIVAGIILALVANAFASRDRKLALVGSYPNALTLPPRETAAPPAQTATQTPVTAKTPSVTSTVPVQIPETSTTAVTSTQPTATAAIETVGLNPAAKNPPAKSPASPPAAAPTPHPPVPTPATKDEDPTKRFPPHPDKPYVEIAFADVNWLHGKKVLFLDARRTSVYEQGHIPGARSYSVWESDIDDKVQKLFAERSDQAAQNLPIVIYCSGGDCEDSHMLAQKLWGIQFNNVYVYKDGFPDWQKHNGPIHTGSNP
jgi:rhodanese-related sulfurtransferase